MGVEGMGVEGFYVNPKLKMKNENDFLMKQIIIKRII